MTLPLFYLAAEDGPLGQASGITLTGSEARHAVGAMRLRPGDECYLADGRSRRAHVIITDVAPDRLTAGVVEIVDVLPAPVRLVLVQALAKGERDEAAVEMATELGVDEIIPWQAERSIVQWRGPRGERSREKWAGVARAAAKQSRRTGIPVISALATTAYLAQRIGTAQLTLVLHEEAIEPLARVEVPAAGEVIVVVGPEGGVSPRDLELLAAGGARSVRLGPLILRSSSAGPAALAVLNAKTRWLDEGLR